MVGGCGLSGESLEGKIPSHKIAIRIHGGFHEFHGTDTEKTSTWVDHGTENEDSGEIRRCFISDFARKIPKVEWKSDDRGPMTIRARTTMTDGRRGVRLVGGLVGEKLCDCEKIVPGITFATLGKV